MIINIIMPNESSSYLHTTNWPKLMMKAHNFGGNKLRKFCNYLSDMKRAWPVNTKHNKGLSSAKHNRQTITK